MTEIIMKDNIDQMIVDFWNQNSNLHVTNATMKGLPSAEEKQFVMLQVIPDNFEEFSEEDKCRWRASLINNIPTKKYVHLDNGRKITIVLALDWTKSEIENLIKSAIDKPEIIDFINEGLIELQIKTVPGKKIPGTEPGKEVLEIAREILSDMGLKGEY